MTAMEAKLDAIMHRMDKQERKRHTAHEIEAVERELMRRSAEVPSAEDSYGAEEVKYANEQRSYHFKPNPNLPMHYNPALMELLLWWRGITWPKAGTASSARIPSATKVPAAATRRRKQK